MKVAITLNDVVRTHYEHTKSILEEEIKRTQEIGEVFELDDDGEIIGDNLSTEKKGILLNNTIDNYRFSKIYSFESDQDYDNFIYNERAFSIFSRAEVVYPEVCQDLNKLYREIIKDHSCTIVSQERGNSKIATLNFLSVNKVLVNNYKFVYDYSKMWQLFDVIITANPFIIKRKNLNNQNKLSVKIKTQYNEHIKSDYEFDNLSEVLSMF